MTTQKLDIEPRARERIRNAVRIMRRSPSPATVAKVIEAFNARPARRATDLRIQGWHVVTPEVSP